MPDLMQRPEHCAASTTHTCGPHDPSALDMQADGTSEGAVADSAHGEVQPTIGNVIESRDRGLQVTRASRNTFYLVLARIAERPISQNITRKCKTG